MCNSNELVWRRQWDELHTRLYSSKMHTACSLTISPSMLCSRRLGGGVPAWSGGCLPGPGGCLPSPGGVSSWSGVGGWYPSMHWGRPPWTEFLTHASENITLPQLRLRAVITDSCDSVHIKTLTLNSITWNCNCKCVQYVTYLCINHNLLLSWAHWFQYGHMFPNIRILLV